LAHKALTIFQPWRVHELEVLDVDGRANGRVRDRAVQVLNLDLDATVARVFALALAACRGLDHLQCRERCQPFGVGGPLVERPLGQLWVQRALDACGVAVEPSLLVVQGSAHDGGPVVG
jgi:hypothetical protein